MFLLAESLKKTLSISEGFTVGRTVIEDNQAFLQLDCGEYITLNNGFYIELLNGDKYEHVEFNQLLNTKDSLTGWSLFAGFDARIKKI